MNRESALKYAQFLTILLVFVFVDQWSKMYASDWLASQRPGHFSHNIVLEIPPEAEGKPLQEFLAETFKANSPAEIERIAGNHTRNPDGSYVSPKTTLSAGETIEVTQREVVVIEGYFDFQYTRNPGAAFGLLSNSDSQFRRPFFVVVSLLAVIIILLLLRGVFLRQQILMWGLSLIAAGAVGNFIDRIRFGYVIDFILWKYTDAYRWPTFNVADALICVGVGLMLIEIIRDTIRSRGQVEPEEDAASPKA
ncbi:MAG: signal peptidase II [Bradymonadaceae bacterium]|nr:signal peptidase II [Lujinxingiaceae bacterium]